MNPGHPVFAITGSRALGPAGPGSSPWEYPVIRGMGGRETQS